MAIILSVVFGIFSVSYLPSLPSFISIAGFLAVFLLFTGFCFIRRYYFLISLLGSFCCGVLYGVGYGYWVINSQLPSELDGQVFLVKGTVVGLPQQDERAQRFHLRVDTMQILDDELDSILISKLSSKMAGKKIAVSWYSNYFRSGSSHASQSIPPQLKPELKTGEYWSLVLKLRRPRGFVNPAGFDYQLYLLQQQIMSTGYVRESASNHRINDKCSVWVFDCWRYHLREKYSRPSLTQDALMHKELGPLLGLMIGDRQFVTQEQWQLLRDTGTIHLLAISGLHIGLAALIGFMLGKLLMRLWQLLLNVSGLGLAFRRVISSGRYFPSLFSFIFAGIYSFLAGFSLPTQRALIMLVIFHLFILFYRKVNPWFLLSSALLGIAILDPLSIHSQGFWLSFLAVGVLFFVFNGYQSHSDLFSIATIVSGRCVDSIDRYIKKENSLTTFKKVEHYLLSFTKAQWAITLGLFLPSVVLLQGTSLSAPLANLIAVPLVSFVTVPLLLLSLILSVLTIDTSRLIFDFAGLSLKYLFLYLQWLQETVASFWYFDFGELSHLSILVAAIGLGWLIVPRGFPHRWLGLVCVVPLLLPTKEQTPLTITFLDVGQGTAIVVETPSHQLVYDTGQHYSERFDTGKHIIAPYLIQKGYKTIDQLIISHSDKDHAGGMAGLLERVNTKQHYSGEPYKTGGRQCEAGQRWQWDDVAFSILWPTREFLEEVEGSEKDNNYSCVLQIRYKGKTILLTGDIEKSVEKELIKKGVLPESVSLLLVPHHGSQTSSHYAWVNKLQPDYAVVTTGFSNGYGHPHTKVMQRYRYVSSQLLVTSVSGAIAFSLDNPKGQWHIKQWRKDHSRYWYQQSLTE